MLLAIEAVTVSCGGVGPLDADAGPPDADAGPPDADAGPLDADAGPPDADAGPPDADAGPAPVDASSEPDGDVPLDSGSTVDAAAEPSLTSLALAGVTVDPSFDPGTSDYTAFVPLSLPRVVLTATAASDTTVEFAGDVVSTEGRSIDVPVGETRVDVTARVGALTRTYRVVLRRGDGVDAFLKPDSVQLGAECGAALAASGDAVVVGCARGGAEGSGTGTAFVFRRGLSAWTLEATLTASNAGAGDRFGSAVAIDGDTVVVGAPGEAGTVGSPLTDTLSESGAAYVFQRDVSGVWSEVSRLKAPAPSRLDAFGHSVALSGARILVGAPGEDGSSPGVDGRVDEALLGAGAAYVFVRGIDGSYVPEAYLKAVDPSESDGFGSAVTLDGDDAAVSALGEDASAGGVGADGAGTGALDSGAVYVFRRTADGWAVGPRLKHPSPRAGDGFGTSIALSHGRLIVGAPGDDGSGAGVGVDVDDIRGSDSGAAVLFSRSVDGTWSQESFLKSPSPSVQDRFGIAVSILGDLLVIGASTEDGAGAGLDPAVDEAATSAGAAYSFRRADAGWQVDAYLKASRPGAQDRFGSEVAIGKVGVMVGAPYEDSSAVAVGGDEVNDDAPNSGAVYVLR